MKVLQVVGARPQFIKLARPRSPGPSRPVPYFSGDIAAVTETKADYIKKRAFDKEHYKKMVLAYLEKFGEARREEIDRLLIAKICRVSALGPTR